MNPQHLYDLVAPELAQVEKELRGYARSSVSTISEIGEYILKGGGKRIRPMLLLLTSRMIGEVSPSTIRLAAVVEFIHNATLVHDDIIDAADTRRGRPSANSAWGNSMTVLAGDWLYMQSFAVALRERNLDVLATLIEVTQKMVEGELLQLTLIGNPRSDPGRASGHRRTKDRLAFLRLHEAARNCRRSRPGVHQPARGHRQESRHGISAG